jgi:phosphopantetheinyl transferase
MHDEIKTIKWNKNVIYICDPKTKPDLPKIKKNKNGQPTIVDGYISISHTKQFDVYALNKSCPVGVDIEPVTRETDHAKLNIKNIKEWTIKEAVIKTLGAESIKQIKYVVLLNKTKAVYKNHNYFFHTFKYKNHFVSVVNSL